MMMMILVKRREQKTTIDEATGSHGITCDQFTAAATAVALKSPESISFVSEVSSPQICLQNPSDLSQKCPKATKLVSISQKAAVIKDHARVCGIYPSVIQRDPQLSKKVKYGNQKSKPWVKKESPNEMLEFDLTFRT